MTQLGSVLIEPAELSGYGPVATVAEQARALLRQQRERFALAAQGYAAQERVRTRPLDLDGYAVQLQCNPARLRSSAARVDAGSVSARPCFLCPGSLPSGQRALQYDPGLLILANPYPVAPEHLTIPAASHTPQRLDPYLEALLRLAADLSPRYTVLYNGPRCGASAPDHLHFQAVPADFLPLDRDFAALAARHGTTVWPAGGKAHGHGPDRAGAAAGATAAGTTAATVHAVVLGTLVCPCVALEGADAASLAASARWLVAQLAELAASAGLPVDDGEPMLNLVVRRQGDSTRLIVIPRVRHRPSTYPAEGRDGILLSPGSVDVAGVCIIPRQEDFDRLDAATLRRIYGEVCLDEQAVRQLTLRLQDRR